jgi:hypothetical protein
MERQQLKRKGGEWAESPNTEDLKEILKRVTALSKKGVHHKVLDLDKNTIILHFTFPRDTAEADFRSIERYTKRIKELLPENCFCLATSEDLKLKVHRPHSELEERIKNLEKAIEELPDKILDKPI